MDQNKNKSKLRQFLDRQSMIESSGGKNIDHSTIKDPGSIHYGASAIGKYGFMPNTVREIYNRYKLSGIKNPKLEGIDKMSDEDIKTYLEQNEDVQEELAEFLGQRVLDRMGGDEQMANYAWQYGHNLTPEKLQKRKYLESDRAKKYSNLLAEEQKQQARIPANVNPVLAENEFDMGLPDQTDNLKRLNKLLESYKK